MAKGTLQEVAYTRSGDKGNNANIGVIAYAEEGYRYLEQYLTEQKIHKYFNHLKPTKVTRYSLPNLLAFNFVIENVLDGGGMRSLRSDAQGKALGTELLTMSVDIPETIERRGGL